MVVGALMVIAVVTTVAWIAQRWVARSVGAKIWKKHTEDRSLGKEFSVDGDDLLVSVGGTMRAVVPPWTAEQDHWEGRADEIRRSFLKRTQETAERWRNIFAGLLTVFGAVFVVNKPTISGGAKGDLMIVGLVLTISLAVHAVAYTGWAGAGMPKMLVNLDARTAFVAETQQAVLALARLRVGIACAAGTALVLTLVVVVALD